MQLHIRYLWSLENSERVRNACLRYLQTSLICFYPEKVDIVRQARQLATELGGQSSNSPLILEVFLDEGSIWLATSQSGSTSAAAVEVVDPKILGGSTISGRDQNSRPGEKIFEKRRRARRRTLRVMIL